MNHGGIVDVVLDYNANAISLQLLFSNLIKYLVNATAYTDDSCFNPDWQSNLNFKSQSNSTLHQIDTCFYILINLHSNPDAPQRLTQASTVRFQAYTTDHRMMQQFTGE